MKSLLILISLLFVVSVFAGGKMEKPKIKEPTIILQEGEVPIVVGKYAYFPIRSAPCNKCQCKCCGLKEFQVIDISKWNQIGTPLLSKSIVSYVE